MISKQLNEKFIEPFLLKQESKNPNEIINEPNKDN